MSRGIVLWYSRPADQHAWDEVFRFLFKYGLSLENWVTARLHTLTPDGENEFWERQHFYGRLASLNEGECVNFQLWKNYLTALSSIFSACQTQVA